MSKKKKKPNPHLVKIADDIWQKLWDIARKRKKPTSPTEVLREIINQKLK